MHRVRGLLALGFWLPGILGALPFVLATEAAAKTIQIMASSTDLVAIAQENREGSHSGL